MRTLKSDLARLRAAILPVAVGVMFFLACSLNYGAPQ